MLSWVSSWMGDPSWSRGDRVGRAHGGYHQVQYLKYKCYITWPYLLVLFSHHLFSLIARHGLNIAPLGGYDIFLSEN